MLIAGILSRSKAHYLASAFLLARLPLFREPFRSLKSPILISPPPLAIASTISGTFQRISGFERAYHDGRPRGSLWRGKKVIGKEALFVILGMKRFKDDDDKVDKFIKTHVLRLLKLDMVAVLTELERQGEVSLAVKVIFNFGCALFFATCTSCFPFFTHVDN